jgi:hypothetical protein
MEPGIDSHVEDIPLHNSRKKRRWLIYSNGGSSTAMRALGEVLSLS